jgi:adenylate kinase
VLAFNPIFRLKKPAHRLRNLPDNFPARTRALRRAQCRPGFNSTIGCSIATGLLILRMQRYPTYLLFGPPGSGKGTQGKVLGTVPRFFHMACGEVFRRLDTRTDLGQEFIKYSSRGDLVPDEVTIELWKATISAEAKAHRFKPDLDALVLDGIPRNPAQAKLIEGLTEVRAVFHLDCPDRNQLVTRLRKRALKDNRLDDASDDVIERRLDAYYEQTRPVLDYYPRSIIHEIDAVQAPIKVLRDIVATITSTL